MITWEREAPQTGHLFGAAHELHHIFGVYLPVSTGIRHGIGHYVLTPHPSRSLPDRARRQKWPRMSGSATSSARPHSSRVVPQSVDPAHVSFAGGGP
jgi:hypothetical protein